MSYAPSVKRTRVSSSTLASVGYDAAANLLELEYQNGHVYRYFLVPAYVHAALLAADSLGAYVNTEIKPTYRYERVK